MEYQIIEQDTNEVIGEGFLSINALWLALFNEVAKRIQDMGDGIISRSIHLKIVMNLGDGQFIPCGRVILYNGFSIMEEFNIIVDNFKTKEHETTSQPPTQD